MYDHFVNIVVPNSIEGSIVAILGHLWARKNEGGLRIIHCDEKDVKKELCGLINVFDIGEQENIPQTGLELWIIGFHSDLLPSDLIEVIRAFGQTVVVYSTLDEFYCENAHHIKYNLFTWPSVMYFLVDYVFNGSFVLNALYEILKAPYFETFISGLLFETKHKRVDLQDNPVLRYYLCL